MGATELVMLLLALSLAATAALAWQGFRTGQDGYQIAAMAVGSVAVGLGILLFATSDLMANFDLPAPVTVVLLVVAVVVVIWGWRRSRWL